MLLVVKNILGREPFRLNFEGHGTKGKLLVIYLELGVEEVSRKREDVGD